MASEHRSSHEYGDIHSTSKSTATTAFTTAAAAIPALDSKHPVPEPQTLAAGKEKDQIMNIINSSGPSSSQTQRDIVDGYNGVIVNNEEKSKSKFDAALAANGQMSSRNSEVYSSTDQGTGVSYSNTANMSNKDGSSGLSSQSQSKKIRNVKGSLDTPVISNINSSSPSKYRRKSSALDDSSTDEDDGDDDCNDNDLFDVTKDDESENLNNGVIMKSTNGARPSYNLSSHQPTPPPPASEMPAPPQNYMNEKDKFLMALESGGDMSQRYGNSGNSSSSFGRDVQGYAKNDIPSSSFRAENGQRADQSSAQNSKNLFEAALNGDSRGSNPHVGYDYPSSAVKANVVGAIMEQDGQERVSVNDLEDMLAEVFDPDCPDFDFDKYLDMGELDEILEKGWRPEESPQIPSSNYPVLGKINHHQHPHLHPTPPLPPSNPHQAWKEGRGSNNSNHNGLARQRFFSPGPGNGIPPLPNPSPSPSSVASAAETLGGGSIKSRKKDELCEEWGFKDSRTADLMMARAKKMKYNSEKKKKLSRLDPQQRYQLFQKLEESGKIHHVRPPPAKVLPRKEYFQAREDEVQRQDFDRRQEEKTRVNRTFEWLHTQVGDHPVSTSRINPGPGPVYSNQEMTMAQHGNNRQISPSSDHNTTSKVAGDYAPFSGRRYSVGDAASHTKSPMLPPIAISSAPSQQKKEKMSFRNEPVEVSGGWGGGKKRSGRR